MIEVAIMVEGQEGVGWDRWHRITRAVEDLGYAGLYRSDHFPMEDGHSPGRPGAVVLGLAGGQYGEDRFGPLSRPSLQAPHHHRLEASASTLAGGRMRLGLAPAGTRRSTGFWL